MLHLIWGSPTMPTSWLLVTVVINGNSFLVGEIIKVTKNGKSVKLIVYHILQWQFRWYFSVFKWHECVPDVDEFDIFVHDLLSNHAPFAETLTPDGTL